MAISSNKKKRVSSGESPSLALRQKRFFLIITLILPVIVLIGVEIGLRVFQYGNEYDLVKKTSSGGKEYFYINPTVGKRYFDPARYFVPQIYSGNFEVIKAQNTFRIFVLGESTPAGFPYQYNATPARILQKQLEILLPEKNIEVVNVGLTGTNSYTVLEFAEELAQYQPDVFIVYSGQNEFYGALGVASTNSIGSERWLIRLYQSFRNLRTFILVENTVSSVSHLFSGSNSSSYSGTLMQQLANDKSIPYRSVSYTDALNAFEKNIEGTVRSASGKNIPILLSTLVTNEGSLPPFVSLHDGSLDREKKMEMESLLESGYVLQQNKKYFEAIGHYKRIVSVDSSWAIAQFRLGQSYEQAGLYDSALIAYGRARDDDGLRFRASAEFNAVIRRIAATNNAGIADVESTFRAHSPNRIIGASLLWEHVHPTFTGYVLLAKSWLDGLKRSMPGLFSGNKSSELAVTDSMLVDRLKITVLDLEIGTLTMNNLLRRWPFSNGPYTEMVPKNNVQQVAQLFVKGKLRWNETHYEMADVYLKENDVANALNEYESVAAMYPMDPFPLMRIGDLYSAVQEIGQAEKAYARSLTLQENPLIRYKIGFIFMNEERYGEASEAFTKAMSVSGSSNIRLTAEQIDEGRFFLALALFRSGKDNEATTIVSSLLKQDPGNEKALRLSEEIRSYKEQKNR